MRKLSLLMILAACGDDGARHTPDATVHDAAHDGAPDSPADASPGAVTVTITAAGSAQSGITVYFQNADNSLVLATTTDANGAASAVMQPGGYVTALQPFLGFAGRLPNDQVSTFIGVKPGDNLRLDAPQPTAFTINFTAARSQNSNVFDYTVFSPCLDSGTSNGVYIGSAASGQLGLSDCGATTDFLVVGFDSTGAPLEYFRATGVAVSANSTVDLTGQTYSAVTAKTFSYANVPANWGTPQINESLATVGGREYNELFSGNGSAATTRGIPAFPGAIEITLTTMFNGTAGQQSFIDWGAFSSTYTLDVGARALVDLTSQPSYSAATHQVSISEGATGVTPDFTRLVLDANRSTTKYWTWTVVSPHATTVTLPTLPTTVYDYNISDTDTVNVNVIIGKVPGGYDAVRANLVSFSSVLQFIASLSGSMTVENYVAAFSGKPSVLRHRTR